MDRITTFLEDQLASWPLALANNDALSSVETKQFILKGMDVAAQHNPARIVSSAARTDKESIKARKCFLCASNRPSEQKSLPFAGPSGRQYDILVNPYPIFREHIVVASSEHEPQSIRGSFSDLLELSRQFPERTFFYNGPRCGASAPDHLHFQACARGVLPLETSMATGAGMDAVCSYGDASLFHYRQFCRGIFAIRAHSAADAAVVFFHLLRCASDGTTTDEPDMNIFSYFASGEYRVDIVLRSRHRSHHYFSEGDDHLTMSPGCADVAGVLVVPVADDFKKISSRLLEEMLSEVTPDAMAEEYVLNALVQPQRVLNVGIMAGEEIHFELLGGSGLDGIRENERDGVRKAVFRDGKVLYDGALHDELRFGPDRPSATLSKPVFVLHDVTIGIGFHWERKQNQTFAGALRIVPRDGKLLAINEVGIEDYLSSVISSEMRPTASPEFLKAHAVISRSWVMARLASKDKVGVRTEPVSGAVLSCDSVPDSVDEVVRWYDQEDHQWFDVCADDHCQRYQGLSGGIRESAGNAVLQTWGEVLACEGELCDARFSKCCGGRMELFSSCWKDVDYRYLRALPDTPAHEPGAEPFCHTDDVSILTQVLNDYDLETSDFYEWKQEYPVERLSGIIARRSGRDIGRLKSLKALHRGPSGRITRLLVTGDKSSFVVGKELEIRKILSDSHLKSSAFHAQFQGDRVILKGRGWGHGVGLCQIGAAVMAVRGYGYREILQHYYPDTEITRI